MSAFLPPLSPAQLDTYFRRIGHDAGADVSIGTLQSLHALHPQYIPFENLSPFSGAAVSLVPDEVFDKLVLQGRGGYCFEHNQLFMRVLQSLGFEVTGLSARVVWMLPPEVTLPRTHMAMLVTIDGERWLADVGFGGVTMTGALALDNTDVQGTPHEDFRLRADDDGFIVAARIGKQWQDLYRITLEPFLPVDYETANWYVSTHPESRFVNGLICCRPDRNGRHTLNNNRYSRYLPGQVPQAAELHSADELLALLRDIFLIDIDALPGLEHQLERIIPDS